MNAAPEVNQLVFVRVLGSDQLLYTRIEDVAPGTVSIALPSDGLTARQLPLHTGLALEWVVERGLVRVNGVVADRVDLGVPALLIELTSEPAVVQRREHARAHVALPLEVWPDPEDEEVTVRGTTLDVSGGGVRAVLPLSLEPAAFVRMSLEIPEHAPVGALARVVAEHEPGVVALEFDEIAPADRERLIRIVFAAFRTFASMRTLA